MSDPDGITCVDGAWIAPDGSVLAAAGTAAAAVYRVAVDGGLSLSFPPACEAEARSFVDPPDVAGLEDLRGVPFCTVDFETSRDLDQALAVERAGDGFVVWYAIADTTHFVRPGSAIHAEAVRRGSTVYLPGLCVPMLPFALCEGLISLLPDVDRRALVFRMVVGPDGRCARADLSRAVIRSRCKTWYAAVQAWVDGEPPPSSDPAVMRSLEAFAALGPVLLAGADRRGMLRVRREEVSVEVGSDGARFVALREGRHPVERWNEQVSLLANQEGARFLTRSGAGVDPIYRVMEPPAPERLAGLARLVGEIGAAHGRALSWDPAGEPLAAFLARVPDDDLGRVVHRQAMLVGGSAGFAPTPGPHAGVAADGYARFTAPMREVVGVFLHAEVAQALAGQPIDDGALRDVVIDVAAAARRRQRELDHAVNELVLDQLFRADQAVGRSREATVMGFARDKVHLTLYDPPIDVKWYLAHAARQVGGAVRAGSVALEGPSGVVARLGDRVRVSVDGYDGERRRWALRVNPGPA